MKNRKALYVFLFLAFFFQAVKTVQAEPFKILNHNSTDYQGGVVIVKISDELKDKNFLIYAFEELYSFNKNGLVFIAVNVDQTPGRYMFYLVEAGEEDKTRNYDFYYTHVEILKKEFGTPWYAGRVKKLSKAVAKQREKEVALIHNAYNLADAEEDYTDSSFITPLKNVEVTDPFGNLRLYGSYSRKNKKVKVEKSVPHGGVDLRAKTRLPVVAINSGKVLLTHYFPLRGTEGNLLVIDHGSGIISLYLHLSKFYVKAGDSVAKGQLVALTGATPRGTPPHLHLMVKIHGTNVDPLEFIKNYNMLTDDLSVFFVMKFLVYLS